VVGSGRHRYEVREHWVRLPEDIDMLAASVTVDSKDRVYCFNRSKAHPVLVFDRDGNFLTSWGAGLFAFPHVIRAERDDTLWLVDRDHGQTMSFTTDGKLLRSWGEPGSGPGEFTLPHGMWIDRRGRVPGCTRSGARGSRTNRLRTPAHATQGRPRGR
jgi:hypothetical protein